MATVTATATKRRKNVFGKGNNNKKQNNMKRLFYLIASVAILFAAAASANAQEARTARNVDTRSIFFKGDFFVGIGAGPSIYHGEQDRSMKFHHRLAPSMDVYIGKWIFPFLGVRIAYTGGHANGVTNLDSGNVYSTGEVYSKPGTEKWKYKQEFDYMSVRGDLMLNITSLIMGQNNGDRLYDISFYGGLGVAKVYDELEASRFSMGFGVYNTFRVAKSLDVVLDVHALAVPEDFEHEVGSRPGVNPNGLYAHDGILTASVGVAYRF